jgi:hypothetical protein
MKSVLKPVLLLLIPVFVLTACKKTITYQSAALTDYMPLQIGKYITYRMDSLKFILVGSKDTVISYLARDVVDDTITDNIGRPSWRIIRYLSDTTGTLPWVPTIAYMVTITNTDVEVVENNLRFIKLVLPFTDNVSWLGNAYIDTRSADSEVPYMDGWNYTYAKTGMPYQVLSGIIPQTVTVNQADQTIGSDTLSYSERDYSVEVYGKGIGLIYKNILHTEYQPPNASSPAGSTIGYGLTLNMIDHN